MIQSFVEEARSHFQLGLDNEQGVSPLFSGLLSLCSAIKKPDGSTPAVLGVSPKYKELVESMLQDQLTLIPSVRNAYFCEKAEALLVADEQNSPDPTILVVMEGGTVESVTSNIPGLAGVTVIVTEDSSVSDRKREAHVGGGDRIIYSVLGVDSGDVDLSAEIAAASEYSEIQEEN